MSENKPINQAFYDLYGIAITEDDIIEYQRQKEKWMEPYKMVDECQQFNYDLKPYVVRYGNNTIHKTNYRSCISAQYISDYIDFDSVQEALAFDPSFKKCKLCFGGKSYFKSNSEKKGLSDGEETRDKIWQDDWELEREMKEYAEEKVSDGDISEDRQEENLEGVLEPVPENQQKYFNYKVQMKRLDMALENEFYLEAIFIEYVIMEDRTASILRYEGNTVKPQYKGGQPSINAKVKKIIKISEDKKSVAGRYFSEGFMNEILAWKEKRNTLMHDLMRQQLTTEDLSTLAHEGEQIVKDLSRLSQNYKKYLERHDLLKG